jgi:hypothetical protein
MPVIPAPRRLRLEDRKLEASLSYIVRSCLKNETRENNRKRNLHLKLKALDSTGNLTSLKTCWC